MMDKYVQHISREGGKWKVEELQNPCYDPFKFWRVVKDNTVYWLPRQDYQLCDPPEVWVDVTKNVRERHALGDKHNPSLLSGHFMTHEITDLAKLMCNGKYRIRKIQVWVGTPLVSAWAFIVEKKELQG